MTWETLWPWLAFNAFVLAMLALDLGVFHRKAHEVTLKEAGVWSAIWVTFALGFNVLVVHWFGPERGLEFLTGYLIEKALAVDNIFVFYAIFAYFAVPAVYQHRVLFWGVLGALMMRAIFILAGAALLAKFHWVIYVFGAILVITAVKLFTMPEDGIEHAMKFFDFINDRGGSVELKAIDAPPTSFGSPLEVFQMVLEHERKVTGMINKLYETTLKENDYPSQVMLHWFIDEQVEEEKNAGFIVDQLQMVEDRQTALINLDHHVGKRE